jgi:flagellar motor switch protein FliG
MAPPRTIPSYELSGPQRAAVILLALGAEYGKAIWSALDEDEIRVVTHAMVQLGSIEADTVEELIVDFVGNLSAAGAVTGTFDRTAQLLSQLLPPKQVEALMEEIKGTASRSMWQRLSHIDPEVLANYLRNEYPQTVAVILSRIRADHAARVLAILPDEFAVDVVNRMLRMENVQKEALEHIEETLKSEFVTTVSQTSRRDAHKSMAEVFNSFDRHTEARFLSALDQLNRDAAKKIRALMFTFEDLAKLDAGSVQTLMRQVDRDTLGRALKGAPESIRSFFFSNMSSRAAKNLQDEMAAMGPIRLKDADDAQNRMVNLAKDLADKGDILISKNRAEEELVY